MDNSRKSVPETSSARFVTGAFGLLFFGVAVAMFFLAAEAPHPFWTRVAAVAIGALGLEALVAALRNRRSLASRIGPLP